MYIAADKTIMKNTRILSYTDSQCWQG